MPDPLRRQAFVHYPRRPDPRLLLSALGISLVANFALVADSEPLAAEAAAVAATPGGAGVDPEVRADLDLRPTPSMPPAPPGCVVGQADPDPAKWTMSADHLGPFYACALADLGLAQVRALVPTLAVEAVPMIEMPDEDDFAVRVGGELLLTVIPYGDGAAIRIESPIIATPWGIRVGDSIAQVRARHRDLRCIYGAAEGDESLRCERSGEAAIGDGDGWRDSLSYQLDPRRLSPSEREVLERGDDLPAARLDRFSVTAIVWTGHAGG